MFIETGLCYAIADKTALWSTYFQQNYFILIFVIVVYNGLVIETILKNLSEEYKVEVVMDILRASIGNATLWEPKKLLKRIIFMMIIFPFVIITSFLQAELTSLISVIPTIEINIKSLDDLINNSYVVFTNNDFQQNFLSSKYYNQIQVPDYGCFDSLKYNYSTACAHSCGFLKNLAIIPEKVKILPDIYLRGYSNLIFPTDYPILRRIRNIYYKLYESGIIMNIFNQYQRVRAYASEIISGVSLDEVKFVFHFQVFGFIFAIIAFLTEVGIEKYFKYFYVYRECKRV